MILGFFLGFFAAQQVVPDFVAENRQAVVAYLSELRTGAPGPQGDQANDAKIIRVIYPLDEASRLRFGGNVAPSSIEELVGYVAGCTGNVMGGPEPVLVPGRSDFMVEWECAGGNWHYGTFVVFRGTVRRVYWGALVGLMPPRPGSSEEAAWPLPLRRQDAGHK